MINPSFDTNNGNTTTPATQQEEKAIIHGQQQQHGDRFGITKPAIQVPHSTSRSITSTTPTSTAITPQVEGGHPFFRARRRGSCGCCCGRRLDLLMLDPGQQHSGSAEAIPICNGIWLFRGAVQEESYAHSKSTSTRTYC